MTAAEVGIAGIGFVAAYIALFFVARFASHTVKQLVAVLGALFTGAAVSFLSTTIEAAKLDPADMLWYGVGLALGLVFWVAIRALSGGVPAMAPLWGGPSPGPE